MIHGLNIFGWKKVLVSRRASERYIGDPLRTFLQLMRSATGNAIFTCGLTMLYTKSWMHMTLRRLERECLKLIPHKKFSFAKVWLMAAQVEIRLLNLKGARQILGNAIGIAPKSKIFKEYTEIELQLGNIDRCRKLYEKYLEWSPENCYALTKYAELEISLCETESARAIFELAINQPALDMPEVLWKAKTRFEHSLGIRVSSEMPKKLKKRPIATMDGDAEYNDHVFPEENRTPSLQILQKALQWKKRRMET